MVAPVIGLIHHKKGEITEADKEIKDNAGMLAAVQIKYQKRLKYIYQLIILTDDTLDISNDERIITIEDAAELRLKQSHVISLETRVDNYDSKSEVTIRDLVRNSLRMRPDRIIVGEVRGAEAFDMLQAMNTGHEGSLTTLHANGCLDALNRLETMVLMNGIEIPVKAIRDYIQDAINIIVNISRLSDGRRKITEIAEITGIKDGEITINPIFKFEQTGLTDNLEVDGEFKLVTKDIKVLKKIKNKGIKTLDKILK